MCCARVEFVYIKLLNFVFFFCFKEEMNANVSFLTAAINLCSEKKLYVAEDMMQETRNMLQELIQLLSLMNTRFAVS